eukprot:NODE_330_length_2952_cov_46.068575_g283_i0.p1 GENE.NODE_330_length_2952_cov_46.068575_g283_i0~~NODE_330_length_2952_cov_46.068575_g283_i0.p1  ORF type:complete len:723 (+),score=93.98 NODE_330_length_2952_cov_46.068575_g283_i0:506-2674(+)
MFMMVLTLYYVLTVPLWIVWPPFGQHFPVSWATIIDFVITAIFVLEIFIHSRTAFVDDSNTLVTSVQDIRNAYIRGWFLPDLLSSLPLDTILRILMSTNNQVSSVIGLLRLIRVIGVACQRLFQSSQRDYYVTASYIRFNYHIVPLIYLGFWAIIFCHWGAILGLALNVGGRSNYLDSLYWLSYTISTCGYGDVELTTEAQRIYALILFYIAIFLNGVVVAKLANILRDKSLKQEAQHKMRETLALLTHFRIPTRLLNDILSFQHHLLRHNLSRSFAEAIAGLPNVMQNQLALYMRIAFISNVPLFSQASMECRIALAQLLQSMVAPPQEFICIMGEIGKEMYFLGHGFAEVLGGDGTHMATLKPGDFFGETAILENNLHHTVSVRALTHCDLFILRKVDFVSILKRFPRFNEQVQNESRRRGVPDKRRASIRIADGAVVHFPADENYEAIETHRSMHTIDSTRRPSRTNDLLPGRPQDGYMYDLLSQMQQETNQLKELVRVLTSRRSENLPGSPLNFNSSDTNLTVPENRNNLELPPNTFRARRSSTSVSDTIFTDPPPQTTPPVLPTIQLPPKPPPNNNTTTNNNLNQSQLSPESATLLSLHHSMIENLKETMAAYDSRINAKILQFEAVANRVTDMMEQKSRRIGLQIPSLSNNIGQLGRIPEARPFLRSTLETPRMNQPPSDNDDASSDNNVRTYHRQRNRTILNPSASALSSPLESN